MRTIAVLLLLLTVGLTGCLSSSAPNDGWVSPMDSRTLFRVAEEHLCYPEDCDPTISLLMTTEKIYMCYNFEIRREIRRVGSRVGIELLGIYRPSICATAPGPATSADPLTLPAGRYELLFTVGDHVDRYDLTVTDDALAVRTVAADTTEPQTLLTWRYPPRSFAYVCGTRPENSWIYGAFLDSLVSTGRFTEFTFPDSGTVPYPLASGGYYVNPPARYFRYASEADFDSAGALLDRFSRQVIPDELGAGISLVSWRQKKYRSS
jgi:hypothetical protein